MKHLHLFINLGMGMLNLSAIYASDEETNAPTPLSSPLSTINAIDLSRNSIESLEEKIVLLRLEQEQPNTQAPPRVKKNRSRRWKALHGPHSKDKAQVAEMEDPGIGYRTLPKKSQEQQQTLSLEEGQITVYARKNKPFQESSSLSTSPIDDTFDENNSSILMELPPPASPLGRFIPQIGSPRLPDIKDPIHNYHTLRKEYLKKSQELTEEDIETVVINPVYGQEADD
ncbi:hypothetical protein [Candidatus Odyssella thessalonicensis]|uniref:hypothetical protein n=1 Tax=Candidatus Odyssella thessalonicensis TaxID=84647 RepID=UPI000225A8C2|nr:hypothetical protein [Candidatus Odyssella thessalonicensis]